MLKKIQSRQKQQEKVEKAKEVTQQVTQEVNQKDDLASLTSNAKLSQSHRCPICFNDYDYITLQPKVICTNNHKTCTDCFEQLSKEDTNAKCPLCKQVLTKTIKIVNKLLVRYEEDSQDQEQDQDQEVNQRDRHHYFNSPQYQYLFRLLNAVNSTSNECHFGSYQPRYEQNLRVEKQKVNKNEKVQKSVTSSYYDPLTSKSKTGGTHHSNFQPRDQKGRFIKAQKVQTATSSSSYYNPVTSKSKTGGTHHSNFQPRDSRGRFCKK